MQNAYKITHIIKIKRGDSYSQYRNETEWDIGMRYPTHSCNTHRMIKKHIFRAQSKILAIVLPSWPSNDYLTPLSHSVKVAHLTRFFWLD